MHAPGSQIPYVQRIVFEKLVLYSEVPTDRVGDLLIVDVGGRGVPAGLRVTTGGRPRCGRLDAAMRQIAGGHWRERRIYGARHLRRPAVGAQVLENLVIGDSKTCANRRV